jgi:hypothetical protein
MMMKTERRRDRRHAPDVADPRSENSFASDTVD